MIHCLITLYVFYIYLSIFIIIIIIYITELGHFLTHSGLMNPEVPSKVCHNSFCQLGNSISLPWVIYYEAFYLHVVSTFSCFPVICPELVLFLNSFVNCVFVYKGAGVVQSNTTNIIWCSSLLIRLHVLALSLGHHQVSDSNWRRLYSVLHCYTV